MDYRHEDVEELAVKLLIAARQSGDKTMNIGDFVLEAQQLISQLKSLVPARNAKDTFEQAESEAGLGRKRSKPN